jgi:hypothetical protein
MEHLENPHALIDENNTVIEIFAFAGHDSVLLEECKTIHKAKEIICCCDYGPAYGGGMFKNNRFYLPSSNPIFILDEETGQWNPPIPKPDSGFWEWDDESSTWIETTLIT